MKLIRVATVPSSLKAFCSGLLRELREGEGYEVVAVSSPGEHLDEISEQEGVRTIAIPMERRISPINDLKSLWKMWRVMLKEKPDMVHSMTPKAGLVTMVAAWLARVPIRIHTFTGLVFPTSTGLKRRILMATDWITCACATHVIPEGEGVKADLLNNHITKKDIRVLGFGNIRGIDLEYYNPALFQNKKENGIFTFVFVGRLVGDKGINELVEAFARLIRLLLVGPYEDDLDPISQPSKDIIENNSSVEYLGSKYGDELLACYAAADCFVFPSYREGFPNTVLEAGAMGLPSIVTDINGSREIIIDGENGTIVPPKDSDALYKAMKHFVETPDDVKRMAANARSLIASRYEQSYVRQCLKDFYKEVLFQKDLK